MVMHNHSIILAYIEADSPVGKQFFGLGQKSIGILQYFLSSPPLSICLPFELSSISLYLHCYFFPSLDLDFNKSIRTFAVIFYYFGQLANFHSPTSSAAVVDK